jgi:hypothetical protein
VTAARPAAQAAARAYRAWARDQLLADKPPLRPSVPGAAEFYETVRQDLELGPD